MDVLTWAWTGTFIEFALVNTNPVTPRQIDSFPHTGLSHPLSTKMNVKSL